MHLVQVSIEQLISSSPPGLVICSFIDTWGKKHYFEDKAPIFTDQHIDEHSIFPQPGVIACGICKEWIDADGRSILTVNTERPWAVDSSDGLFEFDVLREQLLQTIL